MLIQGKNTLIVPTQDIFEICPFFYPKWPFFPVLEKMYQIPNSLLFIVLICLLYVNWVADSQKSNLIGFGHFWSKINFLKLILKTLLTYSRNAWPKITLSTHILGRNIKIQNSSLLMGFIIFFIACTLGCWLKKTFLFI